MMELAFAALATSMGASPRETDLMWHTFKHESVSQSPSTVINKCAKLLAEVRRTPLEDQEAAYRRVAEMNRETALLARTMQAAKRDAPRPSKISRLIRHLFS